VQSAQFVLNRLCVSWLVRLRRFLNQFLKQSNVRVCAKTKASWSAEDRRPMPLFRRNAVGSEIRVPVGRIERESHGQQKHALCLVFILAR
jgi:hypothetical protein